MKILLSAYHCRPDRDSEPGVGWYWATTLAAYGHQVIVLTASKFREPILAACPQGVEFRFIDGPVSPLRRFSQRAEAFDYLPWQDAALTHVQARPLRYDVVHHVTWAGLHLGSQLWRLPLPFVYGPIGGARQLQQGCSTLTGPNAQGGSAMANGVRDGAIFAMKGALKRGLGKAGYEIRRRDSEIEAFLADPADDVPGFHVTQMANRSCRPATLRYRRRPWGDDTRLKYVANFLDVRDQRVLELGPFMGYWSIILEKMGVRENVSVEARQGNLDTCLDVKRRYQLHRTQFVLGDVERLAAGDEEPRFRGPFDLVFCVGVFYHLTGPLPFLRWCKAQSDQLFLGTHILQSEEAATDVYTRDGLSYQCGYYVEGGIADPISGMSPRSVLLAEPELIRMLIDAGYGRVQVLGHDIQNGSTHTTILAES